MGNYIVYSTDQVREKVTNWGQGHLPQRLLSACMSEKEHITKCSEVSRQGQTLKAVMSMSTHARNCV